MKDWLYRKLFPGKAAQAAEMHAEIVRLREQLLHARLREAKWKAGWTRPESGERASGRTNRMLLKALYDASMGERVLVVGRSESHAKDLERSLRAIAKAMACEQLMLRIIVTHHDGVRPATQGWDACVRHVDHAVGE